MGALLAAPLPLEVRPGGCSYQLLDRGSPSGPRLPCQLPSVSLGMAHLTAVEIASFSVDDRDTGRFRQALGLRV